MTPARIGLLAGIALALFGAGSILFDAIYAGGEKRFVGYLVGLFLLLAGMGLVLLSTVAG